MVKNRALVLSLWGIALMCLEPDSAFAAPDQAPDTKDSVRRVCVFDFADRSDGKSQGAYGPMFADSIAVELEQAGYQVVEPAKVRAARESEGIGDDRDKAVALAGELGADVLVTGSYRVEDGRIYTAVTAWDLFSTRPAVATIERGDAGTAVFDSIDQIARTLAERARTSLRPLTPAELVIRSERVKVVNRVEERSVELGKTVDLVLTSSDEGADIAIGGEPAGKIVEGKLSISAKEGTPLAVVIRGRGLRERIQVIPKVEAGKTYRLDPAYREARFEFGPTWESQLPLGVGFAARFDLIPDEQALELKGGASFTRAKIMTAGQWASKDNVPYLSYMVSIATIPFQPVTNFLRVGVTLGAGQDFLFARDGADPLSAIALGLGLSLQMPFPRYVVEASASLRGAFFSQIDAFPAYLYEPFGIFSFDLTFRRKI